jgi:serine/threonine-protein kinase
MIGTTVSHYKILEKLGEGGMGVVYKAQDLKLDRLVALKFLPLNITPTEAEKKRFIHEAKAASALDHPNICTVYEIDETPDGQMFLAMAFYEGVPLSEKIKQGPVEIDEALEMAIQAAEGLHAAHEKGIVHRDIKSGNLMLTEKGQVKLMDFGLAKRGGATMLTKTGSTVGTVPYMSPEQARGEKLDHRTDIWSLGVVLYELIVGRLPFQSEYSEAIVYSIMNEAPKPLTSQRSDVPMELERIVKKCLQKNPTNRYQHADELIVDLRRARAELGKGEQKIPKPARFQWRNWYLIGGTVLVVAILLIVFLPRFASRDEDIHSIAVLPLENLSRDSEQEYFADGMTEALIAELSKISALKVISRTSVMQFKGAKKPLPQIARELAVDGVIEGSVVWEGDQVRITVQLIHGPTDRHLWAESYQRELRGVLALQSEVARAIASQIRVTVTPQEQARMTHTRPVNPEAYRRCLLGRYHWDKRTVEGFKKAADYFRQAIDLDPGYALAYAGLADNYVVQPSWGTLSPGEAYPRAKAAAEQALELDNSLAEPYATLGYILSQYDWDWEGAERAFRRALERNPNYATAHQYYAYYLAILGRHEESLAEIKRAQALDPLSVAIVYTVGRMYYLARQYMEAEEATRKALEMDPRYGPAHTNLGLIYLATGRPQEAVAAFRWPLDEDSLNQDLLAIAYAAGGRREEARRIVEQLEKESKESRRYVAATSMANIYARLGDKDRAFHWLEKALEQRAWLVAQMKVEPRFDPLRDDPRFTALLKKVGLEK